MSGGEFSVKFMNIYVVDCDVEVWILVIRVVACWVLSFLLWGAGAVYFLLTVVCLNLVTEGSVACYNTAIQG